LSGYSYDKLLDIPHEILKELCAFKVYLCSYQTLKQLSDEERKRLLQTAVQNIVEYITNFPNQIIDNIDNNYLYRLDDNRINDMGTLLSFELSLYKYDYCKNFNKLLDCYAKVLYTRRVYIRSLQKDKINANAYVIKIFCREISKFELSTDKILKKDKTKADDFDIENLCRKITLDKSNNFLK
jgi:hypothetical protein